MSKPPRLSLALFLAGATALMSTSLMAFEPNDPLYPRQWQWDPTRNGISITNAWKNGYTGQGVVIGIVDQWLDNKHPDLAANYSVTLSKDFVGTASATDDPMYDGENHGTFVAGMAAAVGGNAKGITGAAPMATLAGLHVAGGDIHANLISAYSWKSGVTSAGIYTNDAEIRILNTSLILSPGRYGFLPYDNLDNIKAITESATRNNVIFVWSAGNDRSDQSPANTAGASEKSIEDIIVVGATDMRGKYASFSCYGANLFVSAPGANVVSTTRGDYEQEIKSEEPEVNTKLGNDYGLNSGTSFSSPIVAGVIALAAQSNVAMDSRWAKHALARSSEKLDKMVDSETGKWVENSAGLSFNNDYGFGLVNADKFVEVAKEIAYETIRSEKVQTASISSSKWEKFNEGQAGVSIGTLNVTSLSQAIESIEVTVNIQNNNFYKDAKITVISPSGTESVILDKSTMSKEAAEALWATNTGIAVADGGLGADGVLNWTFVSNAFWGVSEIGEWKIKFENLGATDSVVNSASIKFNTGNIAFESDSLGVGAGDTLGIHGMALDKSSSVFNVAKSGTLEVEDSIVLNSGALYVSGIVKAYDETWKGLKIYVNGGTVGLGEGGSIVAARGVEVNSGSFVLGGGEISGSESFKINGGNVSVVSSSTIGQTIEMTGGSLSTRAGVTFSATSLSMSGGTFNAAGVNSFAVSATGGDVKINGETRILGVKISASENSYATLSVPAGTRLISGSVDISGFFQAEVKDADGNITTPQILTQSYAAIGGSISGNLTIRNAYVETTSAQAKFERSVNVVTGGYFDIKNNVEITGTDSSGLNIEGEVNARAGAKIKTSVVNVGSTGTLYVGGLGIGSTTIEATSSSALVSNGGTISISVGDVLYANKNVQLKGNTVVALSFLDRLPMDTITFIEQSAGTLTVDDTVSVKFDGEVPTVGYYDAATTSWKESTLEYNINSTTGDVEAVMPTGITSLEPLRLTYSGMTSEQYAIMGALRTCLPEAVNNAVSQDLVTEINKLTMLSEVKAAYDQFLPTNLVTINDMHRKQASAITGTIDRRSREMRNGFPTADLWAEPLFNTYGFSYSANPNAVAATGFRQFAGYEYDMPVMIWANGGYSFSDVDATEHTGKTENTMTNASIGFDYAINELVSVGIFGTYSTGTTKRNDNGSETEGSLRGAGLYVAGSRNDSTGSFFYTGTVSYAMTEYDFERNVKIGDYRGSATASPDGSQLLAYVATGYEWTAGSQATGTQWTTGPSVSLSFVRNSVDGYTESGTGINQLEVQDFNYNSLLSSVGWRSSVRCNIRDTMTFVPELRFSWQHEFLDGDDDIDATFSLSSASAFSTTMNKAGRDYGSVGVGLTLLVAESLTVSLDYDVNLFRADADPEHNINLMVRCRF